MNKVYLLIRKIMCKVGIHGDENVWFANRYCPFCEEWYVRGQINKKTSEV